MSVLEQITALQSQTLLCPCLWRLNETRETFDASETLSVCELCYSVRTQSEVDFRTTLTTVMTFSYTNIS